MARKFLEPSLFPFGLLIELKRRESPNRRQFGTRDCSTVCGIKGKLPQIDGSCSGESVWEANVGIQRPFGSSGDSV